MRADRLVSMLLWLQVHGRTPASELARRHEVSVRTINRDMEALSAAGVPVVALRGRNGGWELPAEYRLSSKWLSGNEVRALAVLTPAAVLADLGLADSASAAWLKLFAALPPPHRDEARFVHERIYVDTSTWQPRRETLPWLPVLKEAVFSQRLVRLRYRLSEGGLVDRRIAPLGLVAAPTESRGSKVSTSWLSGWYAPPASTSSPFGRSPNIGWRNGCRAIR